MSRHRNQSLALLGGLGVGAGIMFLLDPDRGRRRRAWVRDKVVTITKTSQQGIGKTARDLRHRAEGLAAQIRSAVQGGEAEGDILAERVRAKLGRLVSHPHAVGIEVEQGRVVLKGAVLETELEQLLDGVRQVRGVTDVENRLDTYDEAARVPGFQWAEDQPAGRRSRWSKWSPAFRLLAGAAGGAMAIYGFQRRDPAGAAAGALGVGLLVRGASNRSFKRLVGLERRRREAEPVLPAAAGF